jgi:hypothetical protein
MQIEEVSTKKIVGEWSEPLWEEEMQEKGAQRAEELQAVELQPLWTVELQAFVDAALVKKILQATCARQRGALRAELQREALRAEDEDDRISFF